MRRYLLLLFTFIFSITGFSQNSSIKGIITDTSTNRNLGNSVITVLNLKDSTLVSFSRSDVSGNFILTQLPAGKFVVLITNPSFADYVENVELNGTDAVDLKKVSLTNKMKLLQEIIIKRQLAAVRMKGDTTEYAADSFKVKENASVEDLLKKMPGIQVDKNGQIIAQGQKVEKVLVDGEEFFSDDPTVATRNIRADAVDKVQVFDKKSDQSVFTGVDDGEKTRTLNLKLKENKKQGYFGKLSAGGLTKYYTGQGMINAFKGKRKAAAFLVTTNTDKTGLNWQDERSYGSGTEGMFFTTDDGGMGMAFSSGGGDEFGGQGYSGQGLPTSWKGGLHFSNKWDKDVYTTNWNYRFNKLDEKSAGTTFRQNILKDSVYYDRESGNSSSQKIRHSLNGLMEIQVDSFNNIRINANSGVGTSQSFNLYNSEALSEENAPVNKSVRTTNQKSDNNTINSSAIWRRKFRKKGRNLSLTFDQKYNESNTNGFLYGLSSFYDKAGINFQNDTTDQMKVNDNTSSSLSGRFSWSEPLTKKLFAEFNYAYTHSSSTLKRLSYNKEAGKYSKYIDSLSNDYLYNVNTNSAGANFRYNTTKYNASAGVNLARTDFRQTDQVIDTSRTYNYVNIFPRANFSYKFSQFSSVSINYNGSTRQPTIEQLQPVRENSNPLNITIGNPSLKQEFRHSINLNYNNYKVLNQRSIYVGTNYSKVNKGISNSYTVDSLGRRVNQAINVDGNYNMGLYGYYNVKIPKSDLHFDANSSVNFYRSTNVSNKLQNTTNNGTYSFGIGLSIDKDDKYEFRLAPGATYSSQKSSLSGTTTKYWSYRTNASAKVDLPYKLSIGSDADLNFRQKITAFDRNNNVIVWNAFAEKKFFKKETLVLQFRVNDILNQNKGYSRSVNPTSIVERTYTTFMRYGLLTLTWNFNSSGSTPPKSDF